MSISDAIEMTVIQDLSHGSSASESMDIGTMVWMKIPNLVHMHMKNREYLQYTMTMIH